jgi:hypothetical protein
LKSGIQVRIEMDGLMVSRDKNVLCIKDRAVAKSLDKMKGAHCQRIRGAD